MNISLKLNDLTKVVNRLPLGRIVPSNSGLVSGGNFFDQILFNYRSNFRLLRHIFSMNHMVKKSLSSMEELIIKSQRTTNNTQIFI